MLSKPQYGWTDFSLVDTSVYHLSYLDDIAFEWLEEAIHGLTTMRPFCVKGFLEPGRFLCTVSYWNCHIIEEEDERDGNVVRTECSHTSMLDFCKYLHWDISTYVEEWALFTDYFGKEVQAEEKIKQLQELLRTLQRLIKAKENRWDQDRCFL